MALSFYHDDAFLLCDNQQTLQGVVATLRRASAIILDCEAQDIGYVGGQLSVISLGVAGSLLSSKRRGRQYHPVFLVDVLAFSRRQLRSLYDILEDENVTKVVFGGRHDFTELYHGQGVYMKGVIDLQIADVVSRDILEEDFEDQMERLGDRYFDDDVDIDRYDNIHRLNSLVSCVEEHDVDTSRIPHELKPYHSGRWLQRPLSFDQLIYASGDVLLIDLLYRYFRSMHLLEDDIYEQSAKYISLNIDARVNKNDEYWCHALLPLDIIYEADGIPMTCDGCGREMMSGNFARRGGRGRGRREDKCAVCVIIDFTGYED
ncbi:hypothetical protein SISSUDRAFT_1119622 [Sistotremastrum suecicum HHB10207 ss-3]|uniref:3'-5' exonuclease domain-containing protein n=1 Tax=Sistotremastrum suecicum HHB10207 ss-3 TaxID=1314776 RepID=A0A166DED9_9AGAM|nr:hypothetical protein SISSUDRAFT_1119622 [Sistotremastrum suecicum HHB10207 ss-3]